MSEAYRKSGEIPPIISLNEDDYNSGRFIPIDVHVKFHFPYKKGKFLKETSKTCKC